MPPVFASTCARWLGVRADLVYLDLGVSSLQVDARERGFSYSYDAPLDMRMDPDQELTAADVVNRWDERRLARLLREYGEERYAARIARAIAARRRETAIDSTQELVEVIKSALPGPAQFGGGHPAKRTVQAIRIAAKDEPKAIREALWKVSITGVNGPIRFEKDGPAGKESGQSKPSIFVVEVKDGKVLVRFQRFRALARRLPSHGLADLAATGTDPPGHGGVLPPRRPAGPVPHLVGACPDSAPTRWQKRVKPRIRCRNASDSPQSQCRSSATTPTTQNTWCASPSPASVRRWRTCRR